MTTLLQGGTALITGAASGIGRATSLCFARDGCSNLVLGDLSFQGLEETRSLIHQQYPRAQVEIAELDVSDEGAVEAFFARAVEKFGRVDFVASVAGYAHPAQPVTILPEKDYQTSFNVNLRGVFLCQRAALRLMLKQEPLPGFEQRGSIVNVGSIASRNATPGLSVYSATKAGVLGLSKTDALDYGGDKIRINMVAPGSTITPMLKFAMGEQYMKQDAAQAPLKRLGIPEDIANVIVFLASPRAAYVTGIMVPVDGGLSLATGPP